MARRSANKNGIPNPFNPMDPDWQKTTTTTKPSKTTTVVRMSPAGKLRARSVGVSSTKRHATHKPPGAKKSKKY